MYCTVDDLTRILPVTDLLQLASDSSTGTLADTAVLAVISEAIDQADREIDAYVGRVRQVPVEPVPALIANLSARMAIYNLFARRPGLEGYEAVRDRYARALDILRAVADGTMTIGPASGPSARARINTAPKNFGDLQGVY